MLTSTSQFKERVVQGICIRIQIQCTIIQGSEFVSHAARIIPSTSVVELLRTLIFACAKRADSKKKWIAACDKEGNDLNDPLNLDCTGQPCGQLWQPSEQV